MYKILKAETLAAKIHLMVVHAPRVASHCQPGQFIIVKLDEKGERIPLTICDYDREEGTITIVFQEIGVSTIKMAELKAGDAFRDFVGPLGCPSEFVEEDPKWSLQHPCHSSHIAMPICPYFHQHHTKSGCYAF